MTTRPKLVMLLGTLLLSSCLAGSDENDDGSSGRGGTGGASGATSSGGSAGSNGGTSGSATGGTSGSAGTGTGGTSGTTGGSSGSVGSGGSSAGVGGMVCCDAIPTCNGDERMISGPDECPEGASCREVSLCCDTIWCAPLPGQCNAYPACDPGDEEVDGPCPPSASCYTRTLCGSTITCVTGSGGAGGSAGASGAGGSGGSDTCDPDSEHDKSYVSESVDGCAVIRYTCPDYTTPFSNACGCGCEQDASCPEFVDCMPGPDPRPGCTADEIARCPYTEIAY